MIYGEDAEVKVLEGQNKVLSAMYDKEKSNPETLTKEIKTEIYEVSQMTKEDLDDVLRKFKQMQGFHKFLITRRERGEPMPETNEELIDIYRYEKPSFLREDTENERYSKRQRRRMYRRTYT